MRKKFSLLKFLLMGGVHYVEGGDGGSSVPPAASAATPGDGTANANNVGASASIPSNFSDSKGTPSAPLPPDLKTLIPKEYHERGYLKDILEKNDFNALIKRFDGAETLLGKRGNGIPGENATPEEREAFLRSLGKPEKADEYGDFGIKDVPEDVKKMFRELFHKANLTKEQAKSVFESIHKNGQEILKKDIEDKKALDTQFDEMAAKAFGDRQEKVFNNTKAFLKKYAPPAAIEKLQGASNEVLIAMASIVDGMMKDYVKEDSVRNVAGVNQPALNSAQIHAERVKIYSDPAYKDEFSPSHQLLLNRLAELVQLEKNIK